MIEITKISLSSVCGAWKPPNITSVRGEGGYALGITPKGHEYDLARVRMPPGTTAAGKIFYEGTKEGKLFHLNGRLKYLGY